LELAIVKDWFVSDIYSLLTVIADNKQLLKINTAVAVQNSSLVVIILKILYSLHPVK